MIKYIVSLLIVGICFSCNTLKKKVEEDVVVEETVEEEQVKIPDYLTKDIEPQGDCTEEWHKKDRKVIYKNDARIKRMEEAVDGEIYVTARVNRDGYVEFAKIQELKTNVTNRKVLNMALEIVQEYQFEPSETAPKNDCGIVKFSLTTM